MQNSLSVLRYATPYIRLYKGKTFVIKLGGALINDNEAMTSICEQVVLLNDLGIQVVLVHGGGPQATAMQERLGHTPEFVDGRRITDRETLEITRMVFHGTLNLKLVEYVQKFEGQAVGISGVDSNIVTVKRRPPVLMKKQGAAEEELVDFGYVGDIESVQPDLLHYLLKGEYIPVICCLAQDHQGQVLNINADVFASSLAVALSAEKLIILGTMPGILDDPKVPETLIPFIDKEGIADLKKKGVLTKGILPKVDSAISALEGGVRRVHIISGLEDDSILREVFTNEGCGTLVVLDEEEEDEIPEFTE